MRCTASWHSSLNDYITALAWSSRGDWLAVVSAAGEVRLYHRSQSWVELQGATGQSMDALAFSGDGQFLAASGQAGQVMVWSLRSLPTASSTPSPLAAAFTRSHPGVWIDRLAWQPQEHLLAYGVGTQVQIWDVTGHLQWAQLDVQTSSVLHLAWQPQGKLLAVSGHGGIRVWNREDWTAEPKLIAVPGASLYGAWSADGRYLGSGNLDRTLTVAEWNCPPPWLMQGFPGKVRQLAWSEPTLSSDSPLLAAACVDGITVWRRGKSQRADWRSTVLQGHRDRVNAIAFQPGSQLLASVGQDGQLCLWQGGKRLIQAITLDSEGVSAVVWHPGGDYLASGTASGKLTVWQVSMQRKGFGYAP
ncbi:WD-40 repeat protein [Halomicronema hongdechloris C2206]|uniref:WD-40 repeat protein n=1 Tax=Halomicronema hongdechloris C2206 TaxID=1641165 RepID=A0A1Z3HQT2_9CYAN|nr:WD40 repeat domain-containing protein [Halomicronema hongdechloris]ASC72487.1 WD-40 repeat protein [Halomicronema hongdechloris C2206]